MTLPACHYLRGLACFCWKALNVALSDGRHALRRTCLREIVNGLPNPIILLIAICYIALNLFSLNEDRLAIQDWPVWHLTSKGKWMPGQMPPIPDAPLRKHYWRPFQIDWLDAVKVTVTVP
jgi:hypothetical protein